MNVKAIASTIGGALKEHAPGIMTGVGIFGMAASVGLAVWQTPKAHQLLEAKKQTEQKEHLTPVETVKTVWKNYIPAVLTFVGSAGLLIGSGHISGVRTATMATALGLSETAFREYKNQVVKTLGEKKEAIVQDEVAKEKLKEHPISDNQVIVTGKGDHLCYDSISGRYFKSDIEKVRAAVNEINRRLLGEMYISLNEFYDEIGLRGIDMGDQLGWNMSKGYLDVHFTSGLAEDGTPCLVLNYSVVPENDYNRLF